MVCISCILIPLALFVWHRFLQPILGKFFPSLAFKEEDKDKTTAAAATGCPFSGKEAAADKTAAAAECPAAAAAGAEEAPNKKTD